ncbi:hypothetical protein Taro_007905, partial [Colocasia esculenta]|nr:hypothetical protein [Colocasia esculenta]
MALACLVCHSMENPSHSVSSSDNEGRCSAIIGCLTRKRSRCLGEPAANPQPRGVERTRERLEFCSG